MTLEDLELIKSAIEDTIDWWDMNPAPVQGMIKVLPNKQPATLEDPTLHDT